MVLPVPWALPVSHDLAFDSNSMALKSFEVHHHGKGYTWFNEAAVTGSMTILQPVLEWTVSG